MPIDNTFAGRYRNLVTQNKVFNTQEKVPYRGFKLNNAYIITDGEGIIMDTFETSKGAPDGAPNMADYAGSTLIADNLIWNNGSSGMQILNSNDFDIFNNSLYGNANNNLPSPSNQYKNGEIQIKGSITGLNAYNNIL